MFDGPARDGGDEELDIADDFLDELDSRGLIVVKDRTEDNLVERN
jgi:hypothetical protein